MKRRLISTLLCAAMVVIGTIVYLHQPRSRITVANNGAHVIEIGTDGSQMKTRLGPNGIVYFDRDSRIHVGDALISVGRRVKVINTGSGVIRVGYRDASGSEKSRALGKGGSGDFAKSGPINIGDVSIRVGNVK